MGHRGSVTSWDPPSSPDTRHGRVELLHGGGGPELVVVEGAAVAVEGAAVLVEGAAVLVEGAAVLVEGAAVVVEGAAVVVEGAGVVVEGAAVVVERGAGVVERGAGVVEGAAVAVEGAADAVGEAAVVVEGAAVVVEGAAGVVEGASVVVQEAAGVVEGASVAVEGASGVVEGASVAVGKAADAVGEAADAVEEAAGVVEEAAGVVEGRGTRTRDALGDFRCSPAAGSRSRLAGAWSSHAARERFCSCSVPPPVGVVARHRASVEDPERSVRCGDDDGAPVGSRSEAVDHRGIGRHEVDLRLPDAGVAGHRVGWGRRWRDPGGRPAAKERHEQERMAARLLLKEATRGRPGTLNRLVRATERACSTRPLASLRRAPEKARPRRPTGG